MSVVTVPANPEQFEAWNGEMGQRWVADADRRDAVLSPIAELLLDHAAITPGERVLDIGCGCGASTVTAARATGRAGAVTGVDLSAPMLRVARDRAKPSGDDTIAFVQADVQTDSLGGRFDVAISRFGTMFFSDPVAAFTNIAEHLDADGRLCIVTWQPLAANDWLIVPGAALLEFGNLPAGADPGAPGMFAQSDPAIIEDQLVAAGFADVAVIPTGVPLNLGRSVNDAVDYLADSGPGRAILDAIPPSRYDEAISAVRDVLTPHHIPDRGVILGAAGWITTSRRTAKL
jgi:SAM-dependent methyltransferase